MSVPDLRWPTLILHAHTYTHTKIKHHFIILRLTFIIKTVKLGTSSEAVVVAYLIFT